jgi:hypothetical protein
MASVVKYRADSSWRSASGTGTATGVAGYYQQLVEAAPGYKTRLTAIGRERLLFLRERYGEGA